MREKVLFVTNRIFIDPQSAEGGVGYCTREYIDLLQVEFDVVLFPLQYNRSLGFRARAKGGLDVFEDYKAADYSDEIFTQISQHEITKVFINLSSASAVSEVIKSRLGDRIKVILCSHGIEAGDMIHHAVRFPSLLPKTHRNTSAYKLGKTLQKELFFRLHYFDLVLTVSDIEVAIEKWLGAKQVFFVPRVLQNAFIPWAPIMGRLGFVGDVSHYPNYYGLQQLCKSIEKSNIRNAISIRVVGKPCRNLTLIATEFPFISCMGYMDNEQLIDEAKSWMYYLNLVFYYSKGVSTKLAKGMNWGLPVISTPAGNRGYGFENGSVNTVANADEMVALVQSRMQNISLLSEDKKKVELAVSKSSTCDEIMHQLKPVLQSL